MLETVVRPTAKGMFVGNMHQKLKGVDAALAADLIDEGKAAAVGTEATNPNPALDAEPVDVAPVVATPAPAAAVAPVAPAPAAEAAPAKNKGGRPRRQPAPAAEAAPAAPVAGDEAPAA